MIVVDTNIIAYLYLSGERSHQAERLLSVDSHWCAPVLWRSEFRSVLSRYLRKKLLSFEEVLLILEQAESLLGDDEYEVPSAHIMQLANSSTPIDGLESMVWRPGAACNFARGEECLLASCWVIAASSLSSFAVKENPLLWTV